MKASLDKSEAQKIWGNLFNTPIPPFSRRPVPTGKPVATFYLSLALCQAQNARRGKEAAWQMMKIKSALYDAMRAQYPTERDSVLPGRPQVLCCRFSSGKPDPFSDWAKHAVDKLCRPMTRKGKPVKRLGLIHDDSLERADVHQWSEPAKPGAGFAVIEVRS